MKALRQSSLSANAAFLYLEVFGSSVLGYAYWFVVSRLADADTLGTVSAMAAFASLAVAITAVGIAPGATRCLGIAYSRGDSEALSRYTVSSLVLSTAVSMISVILVVIFRGQLTSWTGLADDFLYLGGVIIFFLGGTSVLRAVFISLRRGQVLPFSIAVAGTAKLAVGIGLVVAGWGALGAGIGYSVMAAANAAVLLILLLLGPVRLTGLRASLHLGAMKEVMRVGFSSWLPSLILALGTHLSVLVMSGTRGSLETGFYFIAFAIAMLVLAIPVSIWGILFPVMSGLPDARTTLARRGMKLGLAVTTPVAACLFLGAPFVLGLFGAEFRSATIPLYLLLAGTAFEPVSRGVVTLAYSQGRYRDVLLLGLAANVPRVVLYFALVPSYGAEGAAIAFLSGSIVGFLYGVWNSHRMSLHIPWGQVAVTLGLPIGVAAASYYAGLDWPLGIVSVLAVSSLGFIMSRVITLQEIREIVISLRR